MQVVELISFLMEGFPQIPTLPPDLGSTADIFGLQLKHLKYQFSVSTFSSKIIAKDQCRALKFRKQAEDPMSLCVISTAKRMPAIALGVNKLIRKENISIKNAENNFFKICSMIEVCLS